VRARRSNAGPRPGDWPPKASATMPLETLNRKSAARPADSEIVAGRAVSSVKCLVVKASISRS
jgi:hypothetical protein